jgi:hypothetical protein
MVSMNELVGVFLVLITVLLFYRWVERRHKIVIAKLLVGAIVLVGLVIGWAAYRNKADDRLRSRRLRSVSLFFVPDTTIEKDPLRKYYARDTLSRVSFRLCNNGPDTVLKLAFYPETFISGRSTPHEVRVPGRGETFSSNLFDSDFILAPRDCTTLTWTGHFQVLDSVAAVPTVVDIKN